MKDKYFVVFGLGIRVWRSPKYWRFGLYRANLNESFVADLGPITVYI